MNDPSIEANSKKVLIIGDFSLESVEDKITILGYSSLKIDRLSEPLDWRKLLTNLNQLKNSGELIAVFMYLTEVTMFHTCGTEYQNIWLYLLEELKKTSSLIFVNEGNLLGKFTNVESGLPLKSSPHLGTNKILAEAEQNVIQMRKNKTRAEQTLSQAQRDLRKKRLALRQAVEISPNTEIPLSQLKETTQLKEALAEAHRVKTQAKQALAEVKRVTTLAEQALSQTLLERVKEVMLLIEEMQTSGVEIAPYKKKTDISIRAHQFLDEIVRGVFLHLYVPNGRYQEDQLASLLRLFESYLQRVENLQFFIETRKTLHGQIYEFKSKNTMMNLTDIEVALSRFDQFMSLCQYDQKKAETLLLKAGISPSEASRLMTKYMKEYQRLLLDIEHERERKMLDLRQKLESEALELTHENSLAVSQTLQPTELLSLSHNLDLHNITISNSSVVINPGIQSYVEQAIYGDIHYTSEDKELIELFNNYAQGLESISLRSDLEQLKDTSLLEVERKTAKQKIVGFLSKVAPVIGKSALDVLTAYLEKKLTGSSGIHGKDGTTHLDNNNSLRYTTDNAAILLTLYQG